MLVSSHESTWEADGEQANGSKLEILRVVEGLNDVMGW